MIPKKVQGKPLDLWKFVMEAWLAVGSLNKTITASLIALWFVLRQPLFCRKRYGICCVSEWA